VAKRKGFDRRYLILGVIIIIVAAVGISLIAMPKVSDNAAAEFGTYERTQKYHNNYIAGSCAEGSFHTHFYTMSGATGALRRIVIPVEFSDDPDASVTADIKICEALLGSSCVGDEVIIASNFDFVSNWGMNSGDKAIDLAVPFAVRAGAYYKISIDGDRSRNILYSMYIADVVCDVNRYYHSATGCSSSRSDVAVIYFHVG
jgi:hypothetical protein